MDVSEHEVIVVEEVEPGTPPPLSPFEIVMEIAPRISFATHQCDIPVLASLVARNNTETAVDGLLLRLSVQPAVFAPRSWPLDRIEAGGETRARDRRVSLDGGWLHGLTERMRADVVVELLKGDEVLAREERPIYALARNEWGGATAMPELLAAFVMPNDPAVARLLKDASRALDALGVSGALDGYQGKSRERAWALVSAAWSAVAARRLTYAEPPASFEATGAEGPHAF